MNKNTVLAIAFLIAGTLLTTTAITTMVPSAYADNKQKAKDDSAAAIADCDDNEIEEARFLCIALATNDVEIETEEPPEEGLAVCKVVEGSQEVEPEDFTLVVSDDEGDHRFAGQPPPACEEERIPVGSEDGEINPGEYTIIEEVSTGTPSPDRVEVEGDCELDRSNPPPRGEIQEGESKTCTFINIYEDDS